jgi:hypothetical protein
VDALSNKELFDALKFNALIKEAQFTCEILCEGVTQIRKANYARKGIYFQAFTSLSTGLERIGKLCLILDYIKKKGDYPDDYFLKYLKKEIRHDIEKIYQKVLELKQEYRFNFRFMQDLNSDIYQTILRILSRFAKGDRYSNIDLIVNKRTYDDPIKMWYEQVDLYFFENLVPQRKKKRIRDNSQIISQLMEPFTLVRHTGENGKDILSVEDASYRTGIFETVGPYRQLYTFHIIRFFVEMLGCLQSKIIKESRFEIPYFSEVFRVFYNDDSYIKSRKTWKMI